MGVSGSASGGTGEGGGEGSTAGSGPSAGTAGQSGEACTPMALAALLPEKFVWHSFTGTVFTGAGSACTYCSGSPCGECAVTWGTPAWNGEELLVPIESAECNAAGAFRCLRRRERAESLRTSGGRVERVGQAGADVNGGRLRDEPAVGRDRCMGRPRLLGLLHGCGCFGRRERELPRGGPWSRCVVRLSKR
jgi:hypothetical protein